MQYQMMLLEQSGHILLKTPVTVTWLHEDQIHNRLVTRQDFSLFFILLYIDLAFLHFIRELRVPIDGVFRDTFFQPTEK